MLDFILLSLNLIYNLATIIFLQKGRDASEYKIDTEKGFSPANLSVPWHSADPEHPHMAQELHFAVLN